MRIIKNPIFMFTLGAIIFGSIGVYAAKEIFASNVSYEPSDTTWKKANGEDITNVEEAIDELYNKTTPILLWTNPNPNSNFGAETISLDLTDYKYVVIATKPEPASNNNDLTYNLISTLKSYDFLSANTGHVRPVNITSSSIQFSLTQYGADPNRFNIRVIPIYIYGIKGNMNFSVEE